MPVSTNPIIGYLKYTLLLAIVLFAACVNEGIEECPPGPEPPVGGDLRQLLYLRVTDGATRADITGTEELDDIMVYLFDRDEKLVDTLPYTIAMMRQGIPIDLTDRDMKGGYVTVWANLGNEVETTPVAMGDDIDDLEISLLANDSRADFFLCPGDIFFGYKQVAFLTVDDVTEADTVWIKRKNSRLNITVRGLTDTSDAASYYFRLATLYSAYNFEGAPQLEARHIWESGVFNDRQEFVSPDPYMMIHNDPAHVYSDNSRVLVEIYRLADTRADTLIASGDRDTEGNYILLEQGKTTNVLIVLDGPTGDVNLYTVITPWEEIHQWTIW